MIHDGDKVLDSSLADIRRRFDPRALVFEPFAAGAPPEPLDSLAGVESVEREGGGFLLRLAEGADVAAVMRAAVEALPAARVEVRRPTLEDVYIEIVTGAGAGSPFEEAQMRAALDEGAPAAAPVPQEGARRRVGE
jgi:ABC-type uncharacterized transport system ATPase subunit